MKSSHHRSLMDISSAPDSPSSSFHALRHRPLLWMAPALAAGCALGAPVCVLAGEKRAAPLLVMLVILSGFAVVSSWVLRRRDHRDAARAGVALSLVLWGAAQ